MRKLLLLLSISALVFVSCKKYNDDSQRRKFVSMRLDDGFEISEDPKGQLSFADQSPANPTGFPTLIVSGFSYNKLFFTFNITSADSTLHIGTYTNALSGTSLTLLDSTAQVMTADADQGQLTLHVISVQDSVIQGTFTATVVNNDNGASHTISNGAFRTTFSRH